MAVGGIFSVAGPLCTREAVTERHSIAERRSLTRLERLEGAAYQSSLLRRRDGDVRTSGESDHADTKFLGHPVDESLRRPLRGDQPRRPDVLRAHRQRRVDRDQHRRLLALDAHACVRPRDADDHRGQSDDEKSKRQMSTPAGRRVDEVRQQARRGETSCVALPAPFAHDVQPHQHGYEHETDQCQRRLKAHRRGPRRRKTASKRSQSPAVVSTT